MTLYFAYGSNLNLSQMRRRCPAATPLGKLYLPDTRLVFRGVADVIRAPGAVCPGGLWRLTPACEAALDRYEGYRRDECGMYRKEYIAVDGLPDGETQVMLYAMNSDGICPPSIWYYDGIREGYKDFKLRVGALKDALKHSHDAKHLSHVERRRLRRSGRPLAKARPAPKAATMLPAVREHKLPVNSEASRWTKIRERAQEADRASKLLKARARDVWMSGTPDEIAKRARSNSLAERLKAQEQSGNRY